MASRQAGGYIWILLITLTGICTAEDCSYYDSDGIYWHLSCPGLLDDHDDTECCGLSDYQYCCNSADVGSVASGVIIGVSVTVGIIFFAIVFTIVMCIRIATCPLYRGSRPVVTSTVVTNTSVPVAYPQQGVAPVPTFQNPLAAPVMLQNPPSYNQPVGPTFTPLPEVNVNRGSAMGTGPQQQGMN